MKSTSLCSVLASLALAVLSTSCFTGVESTPRINADHLKPLQTGISGDAEEAFGASLAPQAPRNWRPGKRFLIADARAGRIFTPSEPEDESRVGSVLTYAGTAPAVTLTGTDATDIVFADAAGAKHSYRLPAGYNNRLDTLSRLDVPFLIDLDLVAAADSLLRGRKLYVLSPRWYSLGEAHNPESGLRYVEVCVDSVVPGTAHFPAGVCFTAPEYKRSAMVLINLGEGKANTRSFDKLFAFENPRRRYPEITGDNWKLIMRSQVCKGMSRQECRLALGQPDDVLRAPSYGGMRERWLYSDGVYLFFDDGYLSKFRL